MNRIAIRFTLIGCFVAGIAHAQLDPAQEPQWTFATESGTPLVLDHGILYQGHAVTGVVLVGTLGTRSDRIARLFIVSTLDGKKLWEYNADSDRSGKQILFSPGAPPRLMDLDRNGWADQVVFTESTRNNKYQVVCYYFAQRQKAVRRAR